MAIAHDVDAAAAGLEVRRLERIGEHLRDRYLDPGKLAGCQVLVWRRGHVAYFESLGNLELKGARPVRDDTIWRIFSMTKPITSVALMTLYEEGRFQLSDPVERFIPSWRDLKVLVEDGTAQHTEAPARPMNVRDLLMHTSGLTYGRELNHPAGRMYQEAGLLVRDFDLAEMARRLAGMPLVFHPGTRWHYSISTDICAYLVEILSGRPFDQYLRETVFEPLGMIDTAFYVPAQKQERLAANYRRREDKSLEAVSGRDLSAAPKFKSGGGGLVSTSADYLRFCQMLVNGGTLDGVRVLGPRTVELIRRNHLPGGCDLGAIALGTFGETRFPGVGFGLGLPSRSTRWRRA
jgi:CubicO group peptidase (beta-lactamase class C family)